jgi:hypothetical protein
VTSFQQFLTSKTSYRLLVYSGHTVAGNGSWLLKDGALSYRAVADVFRAANDVVGYTEISTFAEGDWNEAHVSGWSKKNSVQLSAVRKDVAESKEIREFVDGFIKPNLAVKSVSEMLVTSNVLGVVPFQRPTIYLFQGGDGVSAVFGVRGFTLLVDGGYAKQTSCWEFVRHLDRIDALLISHLGVDNLLGVTSFIERYSLGDVPTSLGVVYFNAGIAASQIKASVDGASAASNQNDKDLKESKLSLSLSLETAGISAVERLHNLKIPLLPCTFSQSNQPINLYHKIGFGTLDMYVLNPAADSKDFKEFSASWSKPSKSNVNLSNQVCVATVVVFKPVAHNEKPVRILFPGSTPQVKLFEGFDRLKNIALFQTSDGLPQKSQEKAAARPASSIVDKSLNRPATSASVTVSVDKAAPGRPATTGSTRVTGSKPTAAADSGSAKTEVKDTKKPVSISADLTKKDKKPTNVDLKKSTDAKEKAGEAKDAKPAARPAAEPKKVEAKDGKGQHPTTSTPKKDSPRPAAVKVEPIKKSGSTTPVVGKKSEEGIKKAVPKSSGPAANDSKKPVKKETPKSTAAAAVTDAAKVATTDGCVSSEKPVELDGVELAGQVPQDAVKPEIAEVVAVASSEQKVTDGAAVNVLQVEASTVAEDANINAVVELPSSVETTSTGVSDEIAGVPAPEFDPLQNWGEPQNLPIPADDENDVVIQPSPVVGDSEAGNKQAASGSNSAAQTATDPKPATKPPTEISNHKELSKGKTDAGKSASAQNGKKFKPPNDNKPTKTAPQPVSSKSEPVKTSTAQTSAVGPKKPTTLKPVVPFYVDLAYIPTNAAAGYDVDFFRRVRAQRYVLPGAEASSRVMALLVEAKASWEGDVSVIPSGDVDSLVPWLAVHRDELASLHIKMEPSVTSCMMSLEHATSCTAFRIEL